LSTKRLIALEKSPLLAHTSQTIDGLVLLKAFRRDEDFKEKFYRFVDAAEVTTFTKSSLGIWVNLRLSLLSSIITFGILTVSISLPSDISSIALALVNSLSLGESLYFLMLTLGEGEAELNAVERLYEYGHTIPQEKAFLLPNDPSAEAWPTKGAIDIKDIEIRYTNRPDHAAIKNLSLSIQPGEKIGVCGRTGSGKSTLVTALFRILELSKGEIWIDGQEIKNLGLKTLRSRIQMIPQDPVLFHGTIRSNLDPELNYDDASLWNVLESVGLKEYIENQEAKLDAAVDDNGENLSFGQKQLMCIARALLKQPKILVMDEASSGVDQETETKLQELVMNQFAGATVISIAHRLNTVATFDKIAVLGDGELLEFDTPQQLLSRDSEFTRLVEASGSGNAQSIRALVYGTAQ
jgi:ABC-type multidrug transport system fused ATPase/permease subunit